MCNFPTYINILAWVDYTGPNRFDKNKNSKKKTVEY